MRLRYRARIRQPSSEPSAQGSRDNAAKYDGARHDTTSRTNIRWFLTTIREKDDGCRMGALSCFAFQLCVPNDEYPLLFLLRRPSCRRNIV